MRSVAIKATADDEFELGNEAHNELTIRAYGFPDHLAPTLDLCLALAQDLVNDSSECLSQRGVRYVPSVLVELPGEEHPARQDDSLVQLMDD